MADLSFENELEERLRDLGRHIAFPPTPSIATAVVQSIHQSTRPVSIHRRRILIYAAAAAIALFIAIASIPSARHTVARWFDVPGIHVSWSDDKPAVEVQSEIRQGLGDEVSLNDVDDLADFSVESPTLAYLDSPDEAFYNPRSMNGLVSFVYLAGDDLPAVTGTDVGLLVTQFAGDSDTVWANKSLYAGSTVEVIRINGVEALWIPGTHTISIQPEGAGEINAPNTRSTGSVLIWNQNGVTTRLEGDLSREQMVAIAESMEPIAP
jgi:hypothetical protein